MYSYHDLLSSLAYAHRVGMAASEREGVITFGSSAPIGKPYAEWQQASALGPTLGLKRITRADTTCDPTQWALLCFMTQSPSRADALWEQVRGEAVESPLRSYDVVEMKNTNIKGRYPGAWQANEIPHLCQGWSILYLSEDPNRNVQSMRLKAKSPEAAAAKASAVLQAVLAAMANDD